MAFKRQTVKESRENVKEAEACQPDNHNDCQPSNHPTKMDVAMQKQIVFILTNLSNLTNSVSKLKRQVMVISVIYAILFISLLIIAFARSV